MSTFSKIVIVACSAFLVFSATAQNESAKASGDKKVEKTESDKPAAGKDQNAKKEKDMAKEAEIKKKMAESLKKASNSPAAQKALDAEMELKKKGPPSRIFAKFTLTHGGKPFGEFTAKLFFRRTPKTVDNFIELAEGKKGFRLPSKDPKEKPKVTTGKFYDGVSFHRVIPGFMIQGGDPTGTGKYTPGYEFEDEFHPNLKHNQKGLLSMANPGRPNANGSQFFVTVAEKLPHLDNKHTIFGQVVEGLDVVVKASKVRTGLNDKPKKDLVMEKVEIVRQYKGQK
ncbi:MAG: peptidylprolyl isomerase [Pseudomonadota bacterium]